jgi:hypothetical protein
MCHIFVHKHLCTIYGCPTAPQSEKLVGKVEGEEGKGSSPYWSISCATLNSDVRAWLGLKARAWAWLLGAWASQNASLSQAIGPGLGRAWLELRPRLESLK